MKNLLVLLTFLSATASFAATGSTKCDSGSTMDMVECMSAQIELVKARINVELTEIKHAVYQTIQNEELQDGQKTYAEGVAEGVDTVLENLENTIHATCAAEAAAETVMGSLGKLVYAGCKLDKYKSFERGL